MFRLNDNELISQENVIRNLNPVAGTIIKHKENIVTSKQGFMAKSFRLKSKTKRKATRYFIFVANLLILVSAGLFVINTDKSSDKSATKASSQSVFSPNKAKPLDSLSSADVAVNVARLTGMQESVAVVNKADTVTAQILVASSDNDMVAKPQIIGAGLKSKKDVKKYVTVEGDTIASIADKFGVSQDTIRTSNNLAGNAVTVGKELLVSPVNGIVYKVQSGDTPDSLASRYHANKDNIIAFNDAETTGALTVGDVIVIPDGIIPAVTVVAATRSAGANSSAYSSNFAYGTSAVYSANGYDFGWCTWHAANRRREIGRPIPSNLGNAITWLPMARAMGLPTGTVPQAGAVVYQKNIGGLGHVAFVEKVNDDGSALFSDMNYPIWGKVTYRTIPVSQMGNYAFIY